MMRDQKSESSFLLLLGDLLIFRCPEFLSYMWIEAAV